jgi:hypothetical protein
MLGDTRAEKKMHRLVLQLMKPQPKINYSTALTNVLKQHPNLYVDYLREINNNLVEDDKKATKVKKEVPAKPDGKKQPPNRTRARASEPASVEACVEEIKELTAEISILTNNKRNLLEEQQRLARLVSCNHEPSRTRYAEISAALAEIDHGPDSLECAQAALDFLNLLLPQLQQAQDTEKEAARRHDFET